MLIVWEEPAAIYFRKRGSVRLPQVTSRDGKMFALYPSIFRNVCLL